MVETRASLVFFGSTKCPVFTDIPQRFKVLHNSPHSGVRTTGHALSHFLNKRVTDETVDVVAALS